MNKINKKFKYLLEKNEGALIVGTMPGYPDIKTSFRIIEKIIKSGADILELSSSFINPTLDGPTLANAHKKVLEIGVTKKQIFSLYKKITEHFNIPIFVVEYSSVIYRIGLDKYFSQMNECGINILIIPDILLDELQPFYNSALKHNVGIALTILPTSSDSYIKFVSKKSRGFVYFVLAAGVTGTRKKISPYALNFIKRKRKLVNLPLIAGFGISEPKHIETLSKYNINGFVTCSKIIEIINKNLLSKNKMMNDLEIYIKSMKRAKFKIKNRGQEFWRF